MRQPYFFMNIFMSCHHKKIDQEKSSGVVCNPGLPHHNARACLVLQPQREAGGEPGLRQTGHICNGALSSYAEYILCKQDKGMERNGSRPDDSPTRFGRGQHAIRAQSLRKFEHGNNRLHNGRLADPYFVHGGE